MNEEVESEKDQSLTQNEREGDQYLNDQDGQDKSQGRDKYKEDMFRYKNEARQAAAEKAELARKLEQIEQDRLREKEDYKKLYERSEQKAQELEQKLSKKDKVFLDTLKFKEIEKEALKQGMRAEGLDLLRSFDTQGIIEETTNQGTINMLGVKEWVEGVKSKYGFMFDTSRPPVINGNNPEANKPKTYSPADLLKLQKENKAEYQKQIRLLKGIK